MPFFSRRKKHKHQSSSSISTLHSSAHLSTLSLNPNPSSYSSSPDPVLYRRFSEAPTFDNNNTNTTTTTNASRVNANNPLSNQFTRNSRTANRSVQDNIQNPVLAQQQAQSLESIVPLPGESSLAEPPPVNINPHDNKLSKSKTVLTRPASTDRPGILRRSFSKSKRSGPQSPGAGTSSGTGIGTGTGTGTGTSGPGTTNAGIGAGADSTGFSATTIASASASANASPRLQSMPEEEPSRASLSSNRSKDSSSHSHSSSRHQHHHHRPQDSFSHLDMADRTQTPAGRQSPYPQESRNTSQSTLEQQQQQQQQGGGGGRGTPAPSQKEDDARGLAQKHDELLAKYSKVKRYYFEKEAQVQHLQNTVAHQRMAVSRTVLDDNEYANRFGRLDGAIKDLAFSIRRDWKSLPRWLLGYVNDDAHTVGSKEMTAIGRAFMSRWLVEEIFQRHFHPALDPTFSQQLKGIENNLRHQHLHITSANSTNPNSNASATTGSNSGSSNNNNNTSNSSSNNNTSSNSNSNSSSQPAVAEDKENAIAKISNWRRTTFDGLGDETLLQSPAAEKNRHNLTEDLVTRLVSALRGHLNEPPPVGMDNSARMIVENAVGIAEKIPLESRDVLVEYPLPGSLLADQRMKVETGIAELTNVRPEHRHDHDSEDADTEDTTSISKDRDLSAPSSPTNPGGSGPDSRKKPQSVFSTLMGRRPPPPAQQSHQQSHSHGKQGKEEDSGPARIRFASFMHAEVQGKGPVNVLARAPVYLLDRPEE